jgi:hypothetical protein
MAITPPQRAIGFALCRNLRRWSGPVTPRAEAPFLMNWFGALVILQPAVVFSQPVGTMSITGISAWICFAQATDVTIDFRSMRLTLQSSSQRPRNERSDDVP